MRTLPVSLLPATGVANLSVGEDAMFSDLAVSQGSPVRPWTAIASFSLQAALVAGAVVYPLFHVESLPTLFRSLLPPVATFETPAQPDRNVSHSGGPVIHPLIVNNHGVLLPRPVA